MPHVVNEKKPYTPFPPAPVPSKIDLQLDSGEYFINEAQREAKKKMDKRQLSKQRSEENRQQRDSEFVPSSEDDEVEPVRKSKKTMRTDDDVETKQHEKKRKSSKDKSV